MKLNQLFESEFTLAEAQKLAIDWLLEMPDNGCTSAVIGTRNNYHNATANKFAVNILTSWANDSGLSSKEITLNCWVIVNRTTRPLVIGDEERYPMFESEAELLDYFDNPPEPIVPKMHSDPVVQKKLADKMAGQAGTWQVLKS